MLETNGKSVEYNKNECELSLRIRRINESDTLFFDRFVGFCGRDLNLSRLSPYF